MFCNGRMALNMTGTFTKEQHNASLNASYIFLLDWHKMGQHDQISNNIIVIIERKT